MKSYTDIEQSKKLIELEIDVDTADMHYHYDLDFDELEHIPTITEEEPKEHFVLFSEDVPCWSLSALLELIPPYLGEFKDGIDFGFSKAMNGKWYSAHYIQLDNNGLATFNKTVTGDTAIDAAFEMVCWLKENNKI